MADVMNARAGSTAAGVTIAGDDRSFGFDGIPANAARVQFNDLDAGVRTWHLGSSHFRETEGGIELLAIDADGTGRWTDYTMAYFSSSDDMAVDGKPGEPGHGTRVREAWAAQHAELLRDEAFAQSTDGSATGREHTLISERQKQRRDGELGLAPITVGGARQVLADRDRSESLNDSAREARVYEAKIKHLRGLPALEPGSRESVIRGLQISELKEKIESYGATAGRVLPEDVGVENLSEDDLTAIYGRPESENRS